MIHRLFENFEPKKSMFFDGFILNKVDKQASASLFSIKEARNLPYPPEDRRKQLKSEIDTGSKIDKTKGQTQDELNKLKGGLDKNKNEKDKNDKERKDQDDTLDRLEKKYFPKGKERGKEKVGEKLKPYIDAIGKAFESLRENPSALLDYIESHRHYMKDGGKENYKKWNKDFQESFKDYLPLKKGEPKHLEYGRYGAALQVYMYRYFRNKFKVKVFDLKRQKTTNPFMYLSDGKIGSYTVSVLAAYWNKNFSKNKVKGRGVVGILDYSNLSAEYGARKKNQAVYNNAISKLNKRLKATVGIVPHESEVKTPNKKATPSKGNEGKKTSSPTVVAPSGKETDKPSIPATEDKERAARLKEIEKQLLSPDEVKQRKDKEWNFGMKRIESGEYKKMAEDLLRSTLVANPPNITRKRFSAGFTDLRDKHGGNPNEFGRWSYYGKYTAKINKNNWSYDLFQTYKKAYNKAKENPTSENKKRSEELYKMLSFSAEDFYNVSKDMLDKLRGKYSNNVKIIAGLYDLPKNVNISSLSPKVTSYNHSPYAYTKKIIENPQYKAQREKILNKRFQKTSEIDKFFRKYFKSPPIRIFEDPEDLAKVLKKPMDEIDEFIGVGADGVKDRINEMIRYRNMHIVYWKSKWYKDTFKKELKSANQTILNNAEKYYREYRGKTGKDFSNDVLSGKLT